MQERRFSRAVQAINLALLVLLFVGSLWVYPSLPDHIPKNIGTSTVTYWDTTLLRWLVSPLGASACLVLVYVGVHLSARNPQLAIHHLRNPDTYKTLSYRHKRIVTDIVRACMHGGGTTVLVLFLAGQVHSYLLAMSRRTEPLGFMRWLGWGSFIVGMAGICLFSAWWLPRYVQRLADREERSRLDDAERDERSQLSP